MGIEYIGYLDEFRESTIDEHYAHLRIPLGAPLSVLKAAEERDDVRYFTNPNAACQWARSEALRIHRQLLTPFKSFYCEAEAPF